MSAIDPGTRASARIVGPQGEAAYGGDGSGWLLFAAFAVDLMIIYGLAAYGGRRTA